jgi:hypothetical protein
LNLLFGTGFQTLEASEGRVQVTKGIWMGHCDMHTEKKETIVVFDVEGVDGRERGEKEQVRDSSKINFILIKKNLIRIIF